MTLGMEKISYGGWPNCLRLSNAEIDLVATTDVGPRLIRLGFMGAPNLFKEFGDVGKTCGDKWKNYGGHRLWHAPEVRPRSYAPDNGPIEHRWDGTTLKLIQPTEAPTGIQKEIEVTLSAGKNEVVVRHRLTNRNAWPVELAPWALTVMQGPGRAILPQEPPGSDLLPVRSMALWGYTNMADARWKWGAKFIVIDCDPNATAPQKIGLGNRSGWAAYARDGQIFFKRFGFDPAAAYPDFGCNTECYTRGDMLEVESLGPLSIVQPGSSVEHLEQWSLSKGQVGKSEDEIETALAPLLARPT
jgi:hypothetical protein